MITIREFELSDLDAMVAIEASLFPEDAWSKDTFVDEINQIPVTRFYLTALNEGQVIGYAGLFAPMVGEVADIQTMAVERAFQRQGIGKQLLTGLLTEAMARKAPNVMLEVRDGNEAAHSLYHAAGFVVVANRRNYYAPGVHAKAMSASARVIKDTLQRWSA